MRIIGGILASDRGCRMARIDKLFASLNNHPSSSDLSTTDDLSMTAYL